MAVTTYEGVVEKGKIRSKKGIKLPEKAKVYVIIPDIKTDEKKVIHMLTPRLANRQQAVDFKMQVTELKSNARIRR